MEYCCHIWAGAPSCCLELLGKLQKRICRIVGPSLAASLESLVVESKEKLFHRFTSNFPNRNFFLAKVTYETYFTENTWLQEWGCPEQAIMTSQRLISEDLIYPELTYRVGAYLINLTLFEAKDMYF